MKTYYNKDKYSNSSRYIIEQFITMRDFHYKTSNVKNPKSKYKVVITNRLDPSNYFIVYYGSKKYQHYKDRTPINFKYTGFNHNDFNRRENYRKRHSKIKTTKAILFNKKTKKLEKVKIKQFPSYMVKFSPAFYSWNYLWT